MEYKIEKDIMAPPPRRKKINSDDLFNTLSSLKVGESITVNSYNERGRCFAYARKNDFAIVTKRVEGATYRVWRVE